MADQPLGSAPACEARPLMKSRLHCKALNSGMLRQTVVHPNERASPSCQARRTRIARAFADLSHLRVRTAVKAVGHSEALEGHLIEGHLLSHPSVSSDAGVCHCLNQGLANFYGGARWWIFRLGRPHIASVVASPLFLFLSF